MLQIRKYWFSYKLTGLGDEKYIVATLFINKNNTFQCKLYNTEVKKSYVGIQSSGILLVIIPKVFISIQNLDNSDIK